MSRPALDKLTRIPLSLRESLCKSHAAYKTLGRSGLRVSSPILGCLHLGSSQWLPWVLDEDQALPLLKAAYDRGINTSESIIGKALRVYKIPRRKVVLMTKCYRVVSDAENYDPASGVTMHHELADQSKDYVNQWGLSRRAIFDAVEASLERLGTNYIDVYQIHRYDHTVPPEETMSALHDLVRAGLVRYLGASSMWAYQLATLQHIAESKGYTKFISMQNHYNLIYREEEREMNRFCAATGVGLIPWGPLASGRLARGPSSAATSTRSSGSGNGALYGEGHSTAAIVRRAEEVARKRGWPMSHVGLAWLGRRVTAPVIGLNSVDRIEDALEAMSRVLTADEERYLEELYQPQFIQGHS